MKYKSLACKYANPVIKKKGKTKFRFQFQFKLLKSTTVYIFFFLVILEQKPQCLTPFSICSVSVRFVSSFPLFSFQLTLLHLQKHQQPSFLCYLLPLWFPLSSSPENEVCFAKPTTTTLLDSGV